MQLKAYKLVGAAILCAATLVPALNAFDDPPKVGVDKGEKFTNKTCDRVNPDKSTATGQCTAPEICRDLVVEKADQAGSGHLRCYAK